VLYTLKDAGFAAYLVGGGVRDLLLGAQPKDFDVATGAHPEEVRRLFRSARLIGRRFRLAHVRFGPEIIEVATFRGPPADNVEGRILRDNVYGTLEEDAWRRDFSINSLYYNIRDFSVVDFTGGLADLKQRQLRLIGDPAVRYREDPVRLLRALRFAAKLKFDIEADTAAPIPDFTGHLEDISPARLYEETLKMFMGGAALAAFEQLRSFGVFGHLFPETDHLLADEHGQAIEQLIVQALKNTDTRIAEDRPVTPAFLIAALLWGPLVRELQHCRQAGTKELEAHQMAGYEVVNRQIKHLSFPKRFSLGAREIWNFQPRLMSARGRKALQLLHRPRFRAAYDFLLLRQQAGEPVDEQVDYWTGLQETHADALQPASDEAPAPRSPRRHRSRRRKAPSA